MTDTLLTVSGTVRSKPSLYVSLLFILVLGLGLEVHESPYLVGGSSDRILPGHVFSDEPGVYIVGKVGVRLEDPFYVDADGKGVFLTEAVGGQARTPWDI